MTSPRWLLAAVGLASMCAGPAAAMECRDPWIAQAIYQLYRRMPVANTPTTEECDITHYGGGHWNSYGQLVGYIRGAVGPVSRYTPYSGLNLAPSARDFTVSAASLGYGPGSRLPVGSRVTYQGRQYQVTRVIAQGGGNVVSHDGGTVIGSDGAGVVGPGGSSVTLHLITDNGGG